MFRTIFPVMGDVKCAYIRQISSHNNLIPTSTLVSIFYIHLFIPEFRFNIRGVKTCPAQAPTV